MVRKVASPGRTREPRRECTGSTYPCIVCGEPAPNPRYMLHVVDGGARALVAEDEGQYAADSGDLGLYPIGACCLRKHPELKPCAVKVSS